jgi:hypothetical protein
MNALEKSKRKPTQYNRILLFIVGLIMVSALCAGLMKFLVLMLNNPYVICFYTPFPSYADLESKASFKLPLSARNIEYGAQGSTDACAFWLKFEIDADDLKVFQNSRVMTVFERDDIEEFFLRVLQKRGWPKSAQFMTEYALINDYTQQWTFVDTTDKSRVIFTCSFMKLLYSF